MSKHIYKNMMDQAEPSAELIVKTKSNMTEAAPHTIRRRPKLRTLLIAAAVLALSVTAAFAASGELREVISQVVFGRSGIKQVDEFGDGYENAYLYVRVWNNNYSCYSRYAGETEFQTLGELRQAASFEVKEPHYLLEGMELRDVYGFRFRRGDNKFDVKGDYYGAWLWYEYDDGGFGFHQYYVGADTFYEIETTNPIQKVMIGGAEAAVILRDMDGDGSVVWISMYWIKDGIAYEMESPTFDLETMIAIAESI